MTEQNQAIFEREALCFYRPLPSTPMTGRQLIAVLFKQIKPADYLLVLCTTLLLTLVGMLTPLITSLLFSQIIPVGKTALVVSMSVLLLSAAVSSYLISVVRTGLLERIRGRMEVFLQNAVMNRVIHLPTRFFQDKSAGSISQGIQALNLLPTILTSGILGPGFMALFSLIYIVQVAVISPTLAVPGLTALLAQFAIILLSVAQKQRTTRKELEATMDTAGMVYALITGIQRIKLSGSENRLFARWAQLYKKKAEAMYHLPFPAAVQTEMTAIAALLGTLWVYYAGITSGISIAQFAAFLSAFGLATGTLNTLSQGAEMISYLTPSLHVAEPVLRSVPETGSGKRSISSLRGRIDISHVSFRYTKDGPLILDDLNLQIKAGEYVAIVGQSGCGKSTLMRMLMGFESPLEGAISYDGINMDTIDPASLRRNIGTVLQSGKLFTGDIFSNITISAPWLTLKDAWEAAEMAGLADSIRDMPMGMHTLISEGSGGISGGQKQRLMIARAIASKPKILMFDEATSALDNITQKIVSDSLDKLRCTRIVIAHRLSTIRNCDRIVVLNQGKIIEDGTYDQLMEKGGFFADLVERQKA